MKTRVITFTPLASQSHLEPVTVLAPVKDDECDCPACAPPCESKGKCFIPCQKCNKPEEDECGPLKSQTRRVNEQRRAILEMAAEEKRLGLE